MAKDPQQPQTVTRTLSNAPIPVVDMSPGAITGARPPVTVQRHEDGSIGTTPVFDAQISPAAMQRPRIDREDEPAAEMTREEAREARAAIKPPEAMVVVNKTKVRVQLPAPGQPVGGQGAWLNYGKRLDPREFPIPALKKQGVRMVTETKFDADAEI